MPHTTFATQAPDGRLDSSVPRVLDAAQESVVGVPDGEHTAVLGAPGTGKTTALAALVRARLARPDSLTADGYCSVVALTASRAAATALRDRLARTAARVTAGPLARTVNSLAFQIVAFAAAEQGSEQPTLLTGGEQDAIIAALLTGDIEDGTGPVWPDPITEVVRERAGFRTALRDIMMRAVAAGIEPDEIRALGEARERPEWCAVGDFIDEYRAAVTAYRATSLDAAELVAFATAAVERGEVPPSVAALKLIVIDDAQELVEGEIALIGALARSGVQVVAFGDPDIAASAFRGAEPDILGRLAVRLGVPRAGEIVLDTVYRHGPGIRSFIGQVTARIGTAAAGRQRTASARPTDAVPDPVVHIEAASRAALVQATARRLREHRLFDGMRWERMVVVTRSSAAVAELVRAFSIAEVPATAGSAPGRTRDDPAARALIDAAAVALDVVSLDAQLAAALITGPLGGLDTLAMRRLRLALRREEFAGGGSRSSDALLVDALAAPGRLATIDSPFARRAERFAKSLQAARADAAGGASVEEILWGLWERSGLAALWAGQSRSGGAAALEADRRLDAVVGLFAAAKRFVERTPDAPARVFIDDVLGAELPEDAIAPDRTSGRVRVLTPSATIGVECDVVVVFGLQDGVWPNTRLRGGLLDPDGLVEAARGIETAPTDERAGVIADELRLVARAISRAARQVIIGTVANDDEAPSPFTRLVPGEPDRGRASHPLSLRGMAGSLRRRLILADDAEAASGLARLAAEGIDGAHPDDWYGTAAVSTEAPLVDIDADTVLDPVSGEPGSTPTVSVSPSRIETFEQCPLHWFVQTFGGSSTSPAMGIGTIVHDAMEHATSVDVEALWAHVESRWDELQFESPWIADRERARTRKMVEGLSDYLRRFAASGRRVLGAEAGFALVTGPARVRGSIDRIEIDPDGRISIVDLKTGRTMPSQTKDMAGHAQLGAYQLAVADGAVEGIPEGADIADARLVFVQVPSSRQGLAYTERTQGAFDANAREEYRERLYGVARGMAGRRFIAQVDDHCERERTGAECRIHVVGEVTW